MEAIEIPLKISGIGRAQSQINNIGRQMASLSRGVMVPVVGGGGNAAVGGARQQRAQRPPASVWQQLSSLLSSSRVSFQNGKLHLNPLINRIIPLFMRLGPIASSATLSIGAMAAAAKAAADSINAFREAQITSGGTPSQAALLRNLGIDPQLARGFGQRIASDPMAAGFAARAGVYNPGGEIFGDTNTATNLLKFAEALRAMNGRDALRAARITGTEDLLKFRDISTETFSQLKRDAEQTARIMNPQQIKNAAEYNAQMMRLDSAFSDLKVQLADGLIPIVTAGVKALADSIRWFNDQFGSNGVGAGKSDIFGNRYGSGNAKNPQIQALDANTASLRELAGILKDGVHGGGERARGAVPAGWTGMWYDKWSKNAVGLGAFEL